MPRLRAAALGGILGRQLCLQSQISQSWEGGQSFRKTHLQEYANYEIPMYFKLEREVLEKQQKLKCNNFRSNSGYQPRTQQQAFVFKEHSHEEKSLGALVPAHRTKEAERWLDAERKFQNGDIVDAKLSFKMGTEKWSRGTGSQRCLMVSDICLGEQVCHLLRFEHPGHLSSSVALWVNAPTQKSCTEKKGYHDIAHQ